MFYSTRSKLIGSFLGISLLFGAVSVFIGVRLFGKFIHFNQETNTSRSAGLGLFITREIITKHGGKI